MYDIIQLNNKLVSELKEIAKDLDVPKYEALKKQDLVYKILDYQALKPSEEILRTEKAENKIKNSIISSKRNIETIEEKKDVETMTFLQEQGEDLAFDIIINDEASSSLKNENGLNLDEDKETILKNE